MGHWTDSLAADRMAVDKEFSDRVRESEFTSQEWGLVMAAVEFEIEGADDPETARVVADTSQLPQIMPELDNVRSQMGGMGGAPGGGSGGSGGGVVDSIKGALGIGNGDGGDERLATAEQLAQEYADELQARLEDRGKWKKVCAGYDG